ncbi:hypothetical protein K5I29_05490 [Flavobacterium agricola]|uniref:Uncharacterized protein n=1 Tax=Flavobacterium agricola TaxID=2870839 RepID=A0ABY6M1E0_9FLAO|nr:hypothetical protein [Flavobacterium agricola]UYW02351.1 hypothetical protein K5I29_05490 [Flavobacterium agricola]
MSVTSLIAKEEIAVLFPEQETTHIIVPNFSADFTEAPENDVIQNIRRSCVTKQDAFTKLLNQSPTSSGLVISNLHAKEISEYFLLLFYKTHEEINFLHLFKLY